MSNKRKIKRRRDYVREFRQQLQSENLLPGQEIVFLSGSEEKMSDLLAELVEPFVELTDTHQAYDRLITVATVAWNASLFHGDKRQEFLDDVIEAGIQSEDVEVVRAMREIVDLLIRRKQQLFPDNKRYIISHKLVETRDSFHLSVLSLITPPPTVTESDQ